MSFQQEKVVNEVFTPDPGEEMKQYSPSKDIGRSTLQSTTIDKNNNDESCTTTNSNSNNESIDDNIIIINNGNNNNYDNVPENTENIKTNSNNHTTTTTGAKQTSPSRNKSDNNNNNNSFITSNGKNDSINNIHDHMISSTNNTSNNNSNRNPQNNNNSFMNDAPCTSSSSSFSTVTSIPSTSNNNVNISMNNYVSSNKLNFGSFTPTTTISYVATNSSNSNFNMAPPIYSNNYNSNNVIQPIPKQIPTFNNPQLNVLTPKIKHQDSHTKLKPPTQQQLDNREVKIEKIVTRKFEDGKMFYRIQWEGYPRNCNSWFAADRLEKYKDVLEEHDRRNRKLTEVLSSSNEPLKPNPVDHQNSFATGNLLLQPRPIAKKIKLDPDISNGWTPHINNNNRKPINVHNYSSHPYPSQHGLQRVLPRNILPTGISLQNYSAPSVSNTNPYNMMTKYDGVCNYTTHDDSIKKQGTNLFRSNGGRNSVGPIPNPITSPWNIKTPTQSPARVVPRPIPKILPNVSASPVVDYSLVPVLPMSPSEQYHLLFRVTSIGFFHKGNKTIFTIKFSQCVKTLQLTFERKQVFTLKQTNNNNDGGRNSSKSIPPKTPNSIDNNNQRNSSSASLSSSMLPSTSLISEHDQPKTMMYTDDKNTVASTTTATTTSTTPASRNSSDPPPPVSQLHPLDPLITIEEIYCMNGTEVIVKAILENEKQSKYFPLNDVFNQFPEYLYCFVLNETMRLRPNCVNLT